MNRGIAVAAMAVLMGVPWTPSAAVARTWSSRTGKFTIEAELVDFGDGKVKLKKTDGDVVRVPLGKLCESDREYVAGQRKWTSKSGKFSILAELLGSKDGKARLRKTNGEMVSVRISLLNRDDGDWIRNRLKELAENDQPAEDVPEPVEKLGTEAVAMKLVQLSPPQPSQPGKRRRRCSAMDYLILVTCPQLFYMRRDGTGSQNDEFAAIVQKEPKYSIPTPFRAVATLGSQQYAFALDAVGNQPLTYNQLYFDLNGNGDLTDDKPLEATSANGMPTGALSQFPRVDMKIDMDGKKIDYAFFMAARFDRLNAQAPFSVSLYSLTVREGFISTGRKRTRLVLIDRNSNGRFDDRVTLRRSGRSIGRSEGDLLLINPNPKNSLCGDATMGRDRHYVSKTLCIGKHYYQMMVSPAGDRLKLEPTQLAVGHVTNPSPTYRAIVYSDDCGVLMIGGSKGVRVALPAGSWKVAGYTIDISGLAGRGRTAVTATFGDDYEPVAVTKGATGKLPFGSPFKAVVSGRKTAANKVYLSLRIVGVAGERCSSLYVNGRRPPEPLFEVSTPEGKVVHRGKFEYG